MFWVGSCSGSGSGFFVGFLVLVLCGCFLFLLVVVVFPGSAGGCVLEVGLCWVWVVGSPVFLLCLVVGAGFFVCWSWGLTPCFG